MNKMKNKVMMRSFVAAIGVVAMMLCSSCKKDYNEMIVGKWDVTKIVMRTGNDAWTGEDFTRRYNFRADGLMTLSLLYEDGRISQSDGTWSIHDDILLLKRNDRDSAMHESFSIVEMDEDRMELLGATYQMNLKRVD